MSGPRLTGNERLPISDGMGKCYEKRLADMSRYETIQAANTANQAGRYAIARALMRWQHRLARQLDHDPEAA